MFCSFLSFHSTRLLTTPIVSSRSIVPGSSNLLAPNMLSLWATSSIFSLVFANVLLLGSPMILVRTVWATSSSCAPSNSRLAFFRRLLVFRTLFAASPELPSGNYSLFFLEALSFIHISSFYLLCLFPYSSFLYPPCFIFQPS